MSILINLNEDEQRLIESYAKLHSVTVEQALKTALLETIEDEYDLIIAEQAHKEYVKNPVTYSHDEVWQEIMRE